jgi:hypothetical protein
MTGVVERLQVTTDAAISVVPANEASWDDLKAVFGTRDDPSRCQCQRCKMQPRESWASVGAEELAFRLRTQTDCGHTESGTTSGLTKPFARTESAGPAERHLKRW